MGRYGWVYVWVSVWVWVSTYFKVGVWVCVCERERDVGEKGRTTHLYFLQEHLFCWIDSVTRFGDLLDFGQVFKAFWDQLICPNLLHY